MTTPEIIFVALTACAPIVSVLIAIIVARRNKDKDIQKEAEQLGSMKSDLAYIKAGIDDLKVSDKVKDQRLDTLSEHIARLEGTLDAHLKDKSIRASDALYLDGYKELHNTTNFYDEIIMSPGSVIKSNNDDLFIPNNGLIIPDTSDYNENKTIATTDDLIWKVSKIGDTMTGNLALNGGSGYTSSPKLIFVNHEGDGYLYKDNDSLILNHAGSSSNYTLTFPTITGTVALTSDIKKSRMYKYQIIPAPNYHDSNSDLVVYTTKNLETTTLLNSFQRNIQYLFSFLNGTNASKYGNRIGPAYVETLNNGGIPILYVERTGYGSDATIKPYAYFGSSIRADGYTTATIGEVIKAVIDFDEIPF